MKQFDTFLGKKGSTPASPTGQPLVDVQGLRVTARKDDGSSVEIVKNVDFTVARGEVLALIGESGSGKTTIALSLLGYARSGCQIAGGRIRIGQRQIDQMDEKALLAMRGHHVAYIAQSAAAAFNPARTLMDQVIESALQHGVMDKASARAKAVELFRALALPKPESIGDRYPHQVSGGQLQRVMAAMALITDPELVILDEPTTALDVTTQIEVLRAFKKVVKELGTTAVYVSHDLAVVAQMADRIIVLRDGAVREMGSTGQVLHEPADSYTQSLIAAVSPATRVAQLREVLPAEARAPLLRISGLVAGYGAPDRLGLPGVRILDDINLTIQRGSTVGIIGESGSGKTTLARAVAGMIAPARGSIQLDGQNLSPTLEGRTREQFRRVQIVFQNADTALNPAHSIGRILNRPLAFYHGLKGDAMRRRTAELLDLVKLPSSVIDRLPAELSGGQKQRVNLARALAAKPDLILCDEVTSALDTVVAAAILELLAELRRELQVSYMFISHDISTVRAICDDIVVLYAGRMVANRPREAMMAPPYHPYSHLLLSSVPAMQQGWLEQVAGAGQHKLPPIGAVDPSPEICAFLPRCSLRVDGVCNVVPPRRRNMEHGGEILCHRSDADLQQAQAPLLPVEGVTV
ncbi:ABC transporter ATP-binding protein [Herbaspirillum sp. BH-1]|uniref:Peptide/nickel transport system ATP-binding protein n=1 Tax=Herbaspirillum frisingense TaxID=92645 RepID=A0ABU1PHU2_9BURK|nr:MULTISPECIES: ABC transporter ATP-binding protein [Herbaspirillum]MDR6585397.1 peptide/nickel transport system ATP-binding protein [Herbaspirillum frisingense]PLY59155.1 ABC transporter ATP-binding protein [Herbaspirillum sp. BH-1]